MPNESEKYSNDATYTIKKCFDEFSSREWSEVEDTLMGMTIPGDLSATASILENIFRQSDYTGDVEEMDMSRANWVELAYYFIGDLNGYPSHE